MKKIIQKEYYAQSIWLQKNEMMHIQDSINQIKSTKQLLKEDRTNLLLSNLENMNKLNEKSFTFNRLNQLSFLLKSGLNIQNVEKVINKRQSKEYYDYQLFIEFIKEQQNTQIQVKIDFKVNIQNLLSSLTETGLIIKCQLLLENQITKPIFLENCDMKDNEDIEEREQVENVLVFKMFRWYDQIKLSQGLFINNRKDVFLQLKIQQINQILLIKNILVKLILQLIIQLIHLGNRCLKKKLLKLHKIQAINQQNSYQNPLSIEDNNQDNQINEILKDTVLRLQECQRTQLNKINGLINNLLIVDNIQSKIKESTQAVECQKFQLKELDLSIHLKNQNNQDFKQKLKNNQYHSLIIYYKIIQLNSLKGVEQLHLIKIIELQQLVVSNRSKYLNLIKNS
ncbi:unnamed protein product [Paramecium sonneborni]|nr:unnamed protein product [Paramecium sonneborni]